MTTPAVYLDALRARHFLTTDNAVAKLLKVERATVSNWRAGRRAPDDEQALAIARLLSIPPYRVLLDAAAYRAQTPGGARRLAPARQATGCGGSDRGHFGRCEKGVKHEPLQRLTAVFGG